MEHRIIDISGIAVAETVVTLAWHKGDTAEQCALWGVLNESDQAYLRLVSAECSGASGEVYYVILPSGARAIVMGLGEREKWTQRKLVLAARKLATTAQAHKVVHLTISLVDFAVAGASVAEVMATNIEMATYVFDKYKSKKNDDGENAKADEKKLTDIAYISNEAEDSDAVSRGAIIGMAVNVARDLTNIPGGDLTPKGLAQAARDALTSHGVAVTVLGEAEMTELKMGGILGVSRGSVEEAQLIIMEHKGGVADAKPIVFAGKGITFDSGGLHIKPSNAMDEMHMDMGGAAAVIGAMQAIAQMKLPVNVIGLVPAAENMPSGQSYRPGDILTAMSGTTIEVVSPDAEGRVVLADALTYAERYEPSLVVDVATLTGAVIVALGHYAIGYMTPHEELAVELRAASEVSGDYAWQLPLWEEYESLIKGEIGDVLNAGKNREAGTINGGMFLYQFAKKFPRWAHCDIASTMTTSKDDILASGASGSGTRLLIEIARREAAK